MKVHFVTILARPGSIWDAKGSPNAIAYQIPSPKVKLWGSLRIPGEGLGGHFGACFVKLLFFRYVLVVFVRPLTKERTWSSPRGAGHALRSVVVVVVVVVVSFFVD